MNLIISGTNRPNSQSLVVAQFYQKQIKAKGGEIDILSLTDLPSELIVSDLYGKRSEAFKPLQDKISQANKYIFILPEYNGSFPGVLKTFIDACLFPESYYDKKAVLVGISAGRYGNLRGIDHFTGIANHLNLHIMPLKIHIPAVQTELDESGNFYHEGTLSFINEQIDRFIQF